MTPSDSNEPKEARPAPLPARAKPTPVRVLNGESPVRPPPADVAQVAFDLDGVPWTARVLGRSGRSSGISPPLLLLGFSEGEGGGGPTLEALVSGTSLGSLSVGQLEAALSGAVSPPDPERRKAFFAQAAQSRRR